MSWQAQIVLVLAALGTILFVLRLVRRRELRGKYSLLWLATGAAFLVLAVVPGLLDWLAGRLGVGYAPAILFALAIVFFLLVLVHLSWELTRLEDRTRGLAEDLALLRGELDDERNVASSTDC